MLKLTDLQNTGRRLFKRVTNENIPLVLDYSIEKS